jgi:hypothetical protein
LAAGLGHQAAFNRAALPIKLTRRVLLAWEHAMGAGALVFGLIAIFSTAISALGLLYWFNVTDITVLSYIGLLVIFGSAYLIGRGREPVGQINGSSERQGLGNRD